MIPSNDDEAIPAYQTDRAFIGHPRGLGFLAFTEFWERFSYYGMSALLPLYGKDALFQPGHIERIWGFGPFRAFLEALFGTLTPLTLGGAIAGIYGGLVYLTPLFGGLIADRITGRTHAVIAGAALMALGHFLMAFDQTYLPALVCILTGVGLFKGNLATQVGDLYAAGDLRRADAFQIYTMAIQIAVIFAPLVTGGLAQALGYHWGFGAAGIGMVVGLVIYVAGLRWLPPEPAPEHEGGIVEPRPKLAPGEGKRVAILLLLVPVIALAFVGNQQLLGGYLIWGDLHYSLSFMGHKLSAAYLLSLDAIVSVVTIGGSVIFWRWWGTNHKEPDEITKMTIGTFIAALAPLALVAGSIQEAATGQKVGLVWAVSFHLINDIGFSNAYPVGLALYSRAAPKALGSTMIAVFLIALFLSGLIVAKLATLMEVISGTAFWGMHSALMALAGVIFLIARSTAGRLLAPTVDPEAEPQPA
ncbi:MFS transporter [Sphingomonas sp. CGMCC 1.13654]|uniref:MFS transporter n=1 Tax=Sphingomonas chungangi TaxID=2683589 RepID=A0A838LCJ1_9SPHN|nr:MFS transporter [Sphingomonas chungangi]MBA2936570.1 MFS transporter [Sphingomonas chungangi]MVW55955.1 MFS transporter [Sphingomonas chungangi]